MLGDERIDDLVQRFAFHHLRQLVEREIYAVIGDARLREIVGTDALRPVAGADLPAALGSSIFAILLISQTVASVPSASVITLAPVIGSVGVPTSALAILLGVDRIPDMARTATQVTGHLAAAAVAERLSD